MIASPHALIQKAADDEARGAFQDAAATLQSLLAQWPELADSWYNFGRALRYVGRYEEALTAYDEALKRGAGRPEEIHLNRGVIYADHLRRDEEAEREYTAALLLNPRYTPALINLANCKEDQGLRDEARALYGQALTLEPQNALALARFAGISKAESPADPLIAHLRTALARRRPAQDIADLAFALGRLLDQCGAYDQAFAAYSDANRAARIAMPEPRYSRARQEETIAKLIATFAKPVADAAAGDTSAKTPPVFICGMFRSGSTLAEQVLAAHPRVTAGGELDLLPSLIATALQPFPAALSTTPRETLNGLAQTYQARVQALFPEADIVTDKRPDNFLNIGLIKALFPGAKIIHTVRHPLDTALSIYFQHLGEDYGRDLGDIAHYIRQYRRLMAHWKTLYPDDVFDFDYDGFVADPKPQLERLLAFLGLDWNEACLEFYAVKNSVKTASVWQVRQPLYQKSSGRWKAYDKHLSALKSALAGLY